MPSGRCRRHRRDPPLPGKRHSHNRPGPARLGCAATLWPSMCGKDTPVREIYPRNHPRNHPRIAPITNQQTREGQDVQSCRKVISKSAAPQRLRRALDGSGGQQKPRHRSGAAFFRHNSYFVGVSATLGAGAAATLAATSGLFTGFTFTVARIFPSRLKISSRSTCLPPSSVSTPVVATFNANS